MGKEIQKWADSQQYKREPIPEDKRRKISATLINAIPDPLGSIVVLNGIYKGEVIRSLNDPRVTNEARRQAFDDLLKTVLSGPLESVQFHFLIEGLTRSTTHQMVRSRFSFFAQESLRFAVPEGNWVEEIPLPPHLASTKGDQALGAERDTLEYQRNVWDQAMLHLQEAYAVLVNSGMPAEEARELLPHAMPTRIHWVMDLRTLLLEAGKRTCTQAQFPWRIIFAEIAKVLRGYESPETVEQYELANGTDGWQFQLIAEKIRPACYQAGKCVFKAEFDRSCSIRDRVDAFERAGVPSVDWHRGYAGTGLFSMDDGTDAEGIPAIQDWEWAADPSAARLS